MKLIIETLRRIHTWPSYHLIYEWEDQLQKEMINSCFFYHSFYSNKIIRAHEILQLNGVALDKNLHLFFEMLAEKKKNIFNRSNLIPIVIDFFLSRKELMSFEKAHSHNPLVLITSLEAYEWLKKNECKLNIRHWPLSLPDKYRISPNTFHNKKYDFVLVGRQNSVLKSYLEKYVLENPNTIYVYEGNEKFHYYTNHGEYVGYIESREEYISLMKLSRIGIYSTPGMDGSRQDTNLFNQVTPKFLEYIACGCHLLLRYPENPDTHFYELNKFCPHIDSYLLFEKKVPYYLNHKPDLQMYEEYLSKHYTSERIKQIKSFFNEIVII